MPITSQKQAKDYIASLANPLGRKNFFADLVTPKQEKPKQPLGGILATGNQTTTQTSTRPMVAPEEGFNPVQEGARMVLGAPIRAGLSTALTVAPKKVQESIGSINPKEDFGKVGNFFLGDAPIQPIARDVADTELMLKDYGLKKSAAPVAFAGVLGSTILDFAPVSAGGKKMLTQIANLSDPKAIANLLRGSFKDIAATQVDDLAEYLSKVKEPRLVAEALEKARTAAQASAKKAFTLQDEVQDQVMQSIQAHKKTIASNARKTGGDVLDGQTLKEVEEKINTGIATTDDLDEAIAVFEKHKIDFTHPEQVGIPLKNLKKGQGQSPNTIVLEPKETPRTRFVQDEKTGRLQGSARIPVGAKSQGQEAFGAFAGIEEDEEGNVKFDPTKAALGIAGVGAIRGIGKGKMPDILADANKIFRMQQAQDGVALGGKLDGVTQIGTSKILNLTHLNISDAGKKVIDTTVEAMKSQIEKKVGKVLTNQEVIDLADRSSTILQKAVGVEQTKEWEGALLRLRQEVAAAAQKGTVDENFVQNLLILKSNASDVARKLQSFSIGADAIEKTAMESLLEAVFKVNQNVDEIAKAAQGVDFNDAKQAAAFYRQFVKPKMGEWIDLVRYNSMLSSPLTHIVNTFSNLVNTAAVAPTEKLISGSIDFLKGTVTGERAQFAGEAGAYLKGYAEAVGEASRRFAEVMTGKRGLTQLDVKGIPPAVTGLGGKVSATLGVPMRLLEASDQFFTALAESGERASLAFRHAKGVNVKLADLQAQQKAAYRLFRQDLHSEGQGVVLDAIDTVTSKIFALRNSENQLVSQIAKFTIPFVKTPMNIFKQGIEYSPAGVTTMVGAGNKTEQLSKAIVGSSIAAGTALLLGSGRLSGAEPTDAELKNQWRAAGKQAWSVKIGDTWVAFNKLPPPLSFQFSIMASIDDLLKEKRVDDSTADVIMSAISKYADYLSDQSYVKSIGDMISAAQGEKGAAERVIGNYPQQLIPFRALGGWLARLADDTQRQIDNKAGFIDKQIQLLMLNFPGLSQKLPARTGPTGEPIANQNRVINALSPVRISEENQQFKEFLDKSERIATILRKQTDERKAARESAQKLYNEFKELPKEEANARARAVKDQDKVVFEALKDIVESEKLGLTPDEKKLKQLGVENGERARFILEEAEKMPSSEEKNAYVKELRRKKIITDEVLKQIKALAQ